ASTCSATPRATPSTRASTEPRGATVRAPLTRAGRLRESWGMSLASDLTALLGAEQVDVSDAVRAQHSRGEAYAGAVLPDVVVFPRATAEVARLLAYASAHGVPVTPVGANSSLEGHTVPVRGGVSLDLTRMDAVKDVSVDDMLAVVEPGVVYQRLNHTLRQTGLFFPIDPGAEATLGGMASTNASGTLTV